MKNSLEDLAERMLAKTSTGFQPHPDLKGYSGFTCPKCGRHEFDSASLPIGVLVGSCDGNSHSGNGCTFSWDRKNPQDEANAVYQQTREEWMGDVINACKS